MRCVRSFQKLPNISRPVSLQVLGKVPTITIDKTDGCQMFLNKDTLDVEIVTSKSSEMNVLVPTASGEYVSYIVNDCAIFSSLIFLRFDCGSGFDWFILGVERPLVLVL